jgi:hypothetical protein
VVAGNAVLGGFFTKSFELATEEARKFGGVVSTTKKVAEKLKMADGHEELVARFQLSEKSEKAEAKPIKSPTMPSAEKVKPLGKEKPKSESNTETSRKFRARAGAIVQLIAGKVAQGIKLLPSEQHAYNALGSCSLPEKGGDK